MSGIFRFRSLALARLAAAAFFCVLLAGCATGGIKTFYDEEGRPESFKRRARRSEVNYVHRFRSQAYCRWGAMSKSGLSTDQKMALVDHGAPDFVRRPFLSQYRERTEEWVYLEKSLLLQFVGGELVYTGPVTDLEQILIQRGYPRYALFSEEERGPSRITFIYRRFWGRRLEMYNFADGRLIHKSE